MKFIKSLVIAFLALELIFFFAHESLFPLLLAAAAGFVTYGFILTLPYLAQVGVWPIFAIIFVATIVTGQVAHIRNRNLPIKIPQPGPVARTHNV
jgi:hypothetical protein